MTGEELRAWRDRHGWSAAALAAALGIAVATVERWERGLRPIPGTVVAALADLAARGTPPPRGPGSCRGPSGPGDRGPGRT